jgi:hypothetical protein
MRIGLCRYPARAMFELPQPETQAFSSAEIGPNLQLKREHSLISS